MQLLVLPTSSGGHSTLISYVYMFRRKSKQAQDALLQKVNEDTLKSLTQAKDAGPSGDTGRKVSEVVSYRSHADVPIVRDFVIQVSQLPALSLARAGLDCVVVSASQKLHQISATGRPCLPVQ